MIHAGPLSTVASVRANKVNFFDNFSGLFMDSKLESKRKPICITWWTCAILLMFCSLRKSNVYALFEFLPLITQPPSSIPSALLVPTRAKSSRNLHPTHVIRPSAPTSTLVDVQVLNHHNHGYHHNHCWDHHSHSERACDRHCNGHHHDRSITDDRHGGDDGGDGPIREQQQPA